MDALAGLVLERRGAENGSGESGGNDGRVNGDDHGGGGRAQGGGSEKNASVRHASEAGRAARAKRKKGRGKGPQGGGVVSHPRPKFKLEDRVSLMERATKSKTSELMETLAKRNMTKSKNQGALGDDVAAAASAAAEGHKKVRSGVLVHVIEESSELVRKVERQKRNMERQKLQIAEVSRKLNSARKLFTQQQKQRSKGKRGIPKGESSFLVRLDALHLKLNEAKTRDRELRDQINHMRLQQEDDMHLQQDLVSESKRLEKRRAQVLADIEKARLNEEKVRAQIRELVQSSETKVADMKEEWKALQVFVDATSEKERERLWAERKEKEAKVAEAQQKEKEEAKKALMQFSPFGGALSRQGSNKGINTATGVLSKFNALNSSNKGLALMPFRKMAGNHVVHNGLDDMGNMALAGNLTVNEEKELKSNIQQTRWQLARGQVALKSMEGKADNLEAGFDQIKAKTGIETPAEMVETFLQREEDIFRLFTHVNLLSEQIEELESSMELEREEIERYRGKDGDTAHGRSILQQLDERHKRLSKKTARHEEIGSRSSQIIDRVKSAVASLFVRIGCDTKLIESFVFDSGTGAAMVDSKKFGLQGKDGDLNDDTNNEQPSEQPLALEKDQEERALGGAGASTSKLKPWSKQTSTRTTRVASPTSPGGRRRMRRPFEDSSGPDDHPRDVAAIATKQTQITEKNLLQYIGVIEQRVSEILMIYNIMNRHRPHDAHRDGKTASKGVPVLPSTEIDDAEDWSDEDNEDGIDGLRPLSYEELLRKVATNPLPSASSTQQHQQAHDGDEPSQRRVSFSLNK